MTIIAGTEEKMNLAIGLFLVDPISIENSYYPTISNPFFKKHIGAGRNQVGGFCPPLLDRAQYFHKTYKEHVMKKISLSFKKRQKEKDKLNLHKPSHLFASCSPFLAQKNFYIIYYMRTSS